MRKLAILTLILATTTATSVQAQHRRNHGYRAPVYQHHVAPHYRRHGNWALPLLGGAIIGGIIANEYYQPRVLARRRPEVVCERYRVVDQYGYSRWAEDCYQQ